MPRAIWNGTVIAETDTFETVEGNIYFPPQSLKSEHFTPTETRTTCPWKGTATYYTISVDGDTNEDAAWAYTDPKEAAENIRDHFAFWRGVTVEE